MFYKYCVLGLDLADFWGRKDGSVGTATGKLFIPCSFHAWHSNTSLLPLRLINRSTIWVAKCWLIRIIVSVKSLQLQRHIWGGSELYQCPYHCYQRCKVGWL